MINYIQMIGLTAGAFTSISLIPQVVKSYKTKHTSDISLGMFVFTTTGTVLWFTYGLLVRDIPVICANFVTFMFALSIVIMKIKYK